MEDLDLLNSIEEAADSLYPTGTYPDDTENCSRELLIDAFNHGLIFVSVEGLDIVGFVACHQLGNHLHLRQISVLPDHGRKGYGRALIAAVVDEATERGSSYITLTTFADFPWNAPFYEKMGFTIMPDVSLDADTIRILEKERSEGLENRVAMIYELQ